MVSRKALIFLVFFSIKFSDIACRSITMGFAAYDGVAKKTFPYGVDRERQCSPFSWRSWPCLSTWGPSCRRTPRKRPASVFPVDHREWRHVIVLEEPHDLFSGIFIDDDGKARRFPETVEKGVQEGLFFQGPGQAPPGWFRSFDVITSDFPVAEMKIRAITPFPLRGLPQTIPSLPR